ncbi:LPXTG cell wall anchor domain-containing protein [Paucilactobacillus kaifaensis]|uniref:LPXTG cell wall anchor domain-containing protein n=1 Tax=Paucilactobacillus kaifaensis TaxID=2559921 RepID=UPI00148508EA|nr:LPXTG cell wall anchor domain-containing protein [Paucilactobacillus kaifaensis]
MTYIYVKDVAETPGNGTETGGSSTTDNNYVNNGSVETSNNSDKLKSIKVSTDKKQIVSDNAVTVTTGELPQTDDENESELVGLGLIMASVAGMFGFSGLRKNVVNYY